MHLIGVHPVIGGACVFFFLGADEGSVFHAGNVVGVGPVIQAARELLFIELDHLAGGDGFFSQGVELFFAAVDPDNLVRLAERDHLINPIENIFVIGEHVYFPFQWNCLKSLSFHSI